MADLRPFKAALNRDGSSFMMARGAWRSGWRPVEALPGAIDLYRGLRDRGATPANPNTRALGFTGPYHDCYAPCVEALEALQRKINGAGQ